MEVALRVLRSQAALMKRMETEPSKDDADAAAWEAGCKADLIRNQTIIPFIVQQFAKHRPQRVLDVGTGTGYVPRAVDPELAYRPNWTLVDINPARIALAKALQPAGMLSEAVSKDAITSLRTMGSFDAALLTFTLLEVRAFDTLLNEISKVIVSGGLLIVALPDVWADALGVDDNLGAARALLSGEVEISKTDKFTGTTYPFYARRVEQIISTVLDLGFYLSSLKFGGPQGEVFLLVFRRTKNQANRHA